MKRIPSVLLYLAISLINYSAIAQDADLIPAHDTFKIQSKTLGELRLINVWLPENYKLNDENYPVLYMPDGGIKEDFPHIANTIAELIKTKKIKPFILVGIENTQRRRDLTGPTEIKKDKEIAPVVGGSAQFRTFIKDELFQEISKRYRTNTEKGILGESLAGLFVTETFLLHPEMFTYYIAFDPSLWWNNDGLLKIAKHQLNTSFTVPKRFWFAGSDAKDIYKNTGHLAKILKTVKISNLQWKYAPEPKEQHNTIFRATKEKAFIWSLN